MALKKIPTRQIGRDGPAVSSIGFGSMGTLHCPYLPSLPPDGFVGIGAFYGTTDEEEAYKTLTYAADRGMTFWDCADIYGTSMYPMCKAAQLLIYYA